MAVWFGRLAGAQPTGVDDIEARWDAIAGITSPPLIPAVSLNGRQSEVKAIETWVLDEPRGTNHGAVLPGIVLIFVYSCEFSCILSTR